jgi:hypothetical protein
MYDITQGGILTAVKRQLYGIWPAFYTCLALAAVSYVPEARLVDRMSSLLCIGSSVVFW